MKQKINNLISDMVADLLYYDRKECEDMPVGKIENIEDWYITKGAKVNFDVVESAILGLV